MNNSFVAGNLSGLIAEANTIAADAKTTFGDFSARQINWKPGKEPWSIGQCFNHLITSNNTYFSTFEKIISGEKKNSIWERLPFLPGLWRKLPIKSLNPESTRKLKAPKTFRPSSDDVDKTIVADFVIQQIQLTNFMKATEGFDLEKLKISSPASGFITYSLIDAYRIIITHEQRHIIQAKRVLESESFPKSPK